MPDSTGRWVVIGTIGAPHGVKGAVRVNTALEDPIQLQHYKELQLGDGRRLHLLSARSDKGAVVVAQFKGVDTRDAAQALTHQTLSVPRELLPKTNEEEFYHVDLIGLRAVNSAGETIGIVSAVYNFGAGDILEIKTNQDSLMLAFTENFVPEVNLTKGLLIVSSVALDKNEE